MQKYEKNLNPSFRPSCGFAFANEIHGSVVVTSHPQKKLLHHSFVFFQRKHLVSLHFDFESFSDEEKTCLAQNSYRSRYLFDELAVILSGMVPLRPGSEDGILQRVAVPSAGNAA